MAELKSTKAFGNFKVLGALYDSFGNFDGTSEDVLKSTGTGIEWGDAPDSGEISYVGGTSNSNPGTSSFTLSGLQAGDLVLLFSASDSSNQNTPTGENWIAIPGLTTQPDNDNNPDSAAFYVFAAGTSVTASGLDAGSDVVHVMIAFRNVSPVNPFDVNATENNPTSGVPNPPSITPVTDNSMIVAVGLQDDEDIANSISPPTGYTTALNMDTDGGSNVAGTSGATIMTAYKLLETAAAEDPSAFTSSNSDANDVNKGITIALRPRTTAVTAYILANGGGTNATIENSPTKPDSTGIDDNWSIATWLSTSQTSDNISGFDQPTTTEVTVPATGIYIVNVNLEINTGSNTNDRLGPEVVLRVNSTREAYRASHSYLRGTGGHEQTSSNQSTILSLTAGDTVKIQWRPTCTGRTNTNADSIMDNDQSSIELIRIA